MDLILGVAEIFFVFNLMRRSSRADQGDVLVRTNSIMPNGRNASIKASILRS